MELLAWFKRYRRRLLIITLASTLIGALFVVSVIAYVATNQSPRIYDSTQAVPVHRVAIIFGAYVEPDKSLSPLLRDRVEGGIALYKAHRVQKLLMTGDNGTVRYDEVTAMKQYAVQAGVPAADITLDYAGFDTYDSCYRAHAVFGLTDAVLVTQRYHLARALYLCSHLGVSSDGLAIPDFSRYPDLRITYSLREYLASFKAWVDVSLTHRQPRFLGQPELLR